MGEDFQSLIERAKGGDGEAVEGLILRHLDGLRAYVRLKTGPALRARESCSDLVQSVCREVLGDLAGAEFADEDAFRRWLCGVAFHKITHKAEYHGALKREAAREVPLLDLYGSFCTPSRHAEAEEEVRRIEAAFDELPEDHREVILQVRLLGRTQREVAAEMGKSEEALRQLLSRARARLALLLER